MKIKFSEFLKNTNGKYSGSGLIGVFAGFSSILILLSGAVAFYLKFSESLVLMDRALMALTISAALLGVRKLSKTDAGFSQGLNKEKEEKENNTGG
jgi:hypothetical protein